MIFYSDVKKARLLLKSVRDTNPKHPPGKYNRVRSMSAASLNIAIFLSDENL